MQSKRYYHTLTIAGFDASGGAGIQADLKTFSALGCYGMTVLTALPIQNTKGVRAIYSIADQCIAEQLESILEDMPIDAIKIGMLHRSEVVSLVIRALEKYPNQKIVLDPVMAAKSGDALLTFDAMAVMKEKLFPLVTLLTPNLPEASFLLQRPINKREQMEQAAIDLMNMGLKAVILKGGHLLSGPCADCLCVRSSSPEIYWFSSPRIGTKNTHGTGCTFSAAVTAYLAQGLDLVEAVRQAKSYLSSCIEAGARFEIGHGNGPVHHFFSFWKDPLHEPQNQRLSSKRVEMPPFKE